MTAPTVPGLAFLNAHGLEITTAHTIAGDCENCDEDPAVLRVYGQPALDVFRPVECMQVCATCGPWVVSLAVEQQDPCSRRPIQVEIQAGA